MKIAQILVGISLVACMGPRGLMAENPGERTAIRRDIGRSMSSEVAEKKEKTGGPSGVAETAWRVADLKPLANTPVPGVESSGYGWRQDPIRKRNIKFHKGRDFRAPKGTPVYAAGAGTVIFAGRQSGYGRVIYVDHGDGLTTRYAHLSALTAKKGEQVVGGEQVGNVGSSGRATGNHLHFEVRIDGRAIDPVAALRIADLQRTKPAEANKMVVELAPEVQDDLEDEHSSHTSRPDRDVAATPVHRPDRKPSESESKAAASKGASSGARIW